MTLAQETLALNTSMEIPQEFSDSSSYITMGARHRMDAVDTINKSPSAPLTDYVIPKIPMEIVAIILQNPSSLYTPYNLANAEIPVSVETSLTRRQIRAQEREIERHNRSLRVLASNVLCRALQKMGLGS